MPQEKLVYELSSGMIKGKSISIFEGVARDTLGADSLYTINYETHISMYSSKTKVYARIPDFVPVYAFSDYKKMGDIYHGEQYYYPDKNEAKFFAQKEGGKKDSTIVKGKYPIQDITTLPYFVRISDVDIGRMWKVSLIQGDYVLKCVGKVPNKKYRNVVKSDSLWYIRSEDNKIKIYLSCDEDKYPVYIKVKNSRFTSNVLKLKSIEKPSN